MSPQHITGPIYMIDAPYQGENNVLGTYLLKGKDIVVIDPGPASSVPGVITAIRQLGIKQLKTIALTHIHLDHAAGCWKILEEYPEAVIHNHPRGTQHMINPTKIKAAAKQVFGDGINQYGDIKGISPEKLVDSTDGEILDYDGFTLQVFWTPGHSSHSHTYYEPDHKVLFVGDAAGHNPKAIGIPLPTSPPPFNPVKAVESVNRLIKLDPEIICISHFGYHHDAVGWLKNYREQVDRWTKISLEGVDEGLDLRGLYKKLNTEDPEVKAAVGNSEEAKSTVYGGLVGFYQYAKWVRKNQ